MEKEKREEKVGSPYLIKDPIRAYGDDQLQEICELLDCRYEHERSDIGVIAGSYALYMVQPDGHAWSPSDLDIFIYDGPNGQMNFRNICKSLQMQGYTEVADTNNAKTFDPPSEGMKIFCYNKVQVIKPRKDRKTAEEVLNSFDISVSRCALLNPYQALVHTKADEDMKEGKFHFLLRTDAVIDMVRMFKYQKKGYVATMADVIQTLESWSNMPYTKRQEYRRKFLGEHSERRAWSEPTY